MAEYVVDLSIRKAGIEPVVCCDDEQIEAAKIRNGSAEYIYLINHGNRDVKITADKKYYELLSEKVMNTEFILPPKEVFILN